MVSSWRFAGLLLIVFCGLVALSHGACLGFAHWSLNAKCIDGYWTSNYSVIVGTATTSEPNTIAVEKLSIAYPTRITGNFSIVKQGALELLPPLSNSRWSPSSTVLLKLDNCISNTSLPPNITLSSDDARWLAQQFSPYYVAGIGTSCSTWDLGNTWTSMFPNNLQTPSYPQHVCENIQNRYQATTSNQLWTLNLIFKHYTDYVRCSAPSAPIARAPVAKKGLTPATIVAICIFSISIPSAFFWIYKDNILGFIASFFSSLLDCCVGCCDRSTDDEEASLLVPAPPGATTAFVPAAVPAPVPAASDADSEGKKKKKKKKKKKDDLDDTTKYTPLEDWSKDGPNEGSAAAFVSYEAGRY